MNSRKNLAAKVVGAMAIAALMGTSAFAETRHFDATDSDHNRGDRSSRHERSDRSGGQTQTHEQRNTTTTAPQTYERHDASRNSGTWNRNESRNNNGTWNRNETRNNSTFERSQAESYRNNNRSYDRNRTYDRNRGYDNRGYDRNRGYSPSYGRGNAYYHDGRVSRIERWNGGFRIYVGGAPYPLSLIHI